MVMRFECHRCGRRIMIPELKSEKQIPYCENCDEEMEMDIDFSVAQLSYGTAKYIKKVKR